MARSWLHQNEIWLITSNNKLLKDHVAAFSSSTQLFYAHALNSLQNVRRLLNIAKGCRSSFKQFQESLLDSIQFRRMVPPDVLVDFTEIRG